MAPKHGKSSNNDSGKLYEGVPAVGSSSNIILLFQLLELRLQQWVNFFLSLACLLVIGVNVVLIVINADKEYAEEIKALFHNTEFWTTFMYSLVELGALLFSPHCLRGITLTPFLLKLLMALSIILAFVPALLVAIDIDRFEFASHVTEYTATIILSLTDTVLMLCLFFGPGTFKTRNLCLLLLSLLAVCAGITMLVVYNTVDGDGLGEQVAHFLEFAVNIVNATVIFWFTTDSRLLTSSWIQQLMQVPADGVVTTAPQNDPPAFPHEHLAEEDATPLAQSYTDHPGDTTPVYGHGPFTFGSAPSLARPGTATP